MKGLVMSRRLLLPVIALMLLASVASSAHAAEPPTVVINSLISTGETTAEVSGTIEVHENAEGTAAFVEASSQEEPWEKISQGFAAQFEPGETGVKAFTAVIENLEPETTYYFRVGTSRFTGAEQISSPETPPYPSATTGAATPVPPIISTEAVTSVGPEEATFNAEINPRRFSTIYTFEYAPAAAIEAEGWSSPTVQRSPPLPAVPADNVRHQVSYRISGLRPAETYRWRVVAENIGGQTVSNDNFLTTQGLGPESRGASGSCPNEQFRVGLGAYLPDCRAYEQATPTDKNGMNVQGLPDWLVASSDPTAPRVGFIEATVSGLPAKRGGRQEVTPMLSSLEGGSWSTQSMLPSETEQARSALYRGKSENMRYAIVEVNDSPLRSGSAVRRVILELVDTVTGAITPIASGQTEEASLRSVFAIDAVSDDGSYVFFESELAVAPGAAPFWINLYRWSRATDSVSLVGVLPSGEAPQFGSFGGAYSWSGSVNTFNGGATAAQYVEAIHAMTPDGDQIYFTAPGEPPLIYLRRGLNGPTPSSIEVSKPNVGVVDPHVEEEFGLRMPAAFQEATPDGSRAFFTSSEKLTADAATGEFDKGTDLYRFDTATESLTDVTGGLESVQNPNGAKVVALLGASADGTSGYFVAEGQLAEGATSGSPNIYRFSEDGAGSYHLGFVATLAGKEEPDSFNWSTSTYAAFPLNTAGNAKSSRVSRDGNELLFSSVATITTYNNRGCGPAASPHGPCTEIYLYSADKHRLDCISCNPTGEVAIGAASLSGGPVNYTNLVVPDSRPEAHLTRNISSDGERVFFQTPDSLLPRDTNSASCRFLAHSAVAPRALPTCVDVYEWEAPGALGGSCTKAEVHGGCLYLLSGGNSDAPANLVDATPDGSSAYIATSSPLVPIDRDELTDIYDVRAGGGQASQFVLPGASCEGEACRASASSPPAPATAGTSSFAGSGNVKAKPCKKGKSKKGKKPCKKHQKHKKHKKRHKGNQGSKVHTKHDRAGSIKGGQK
jgi:hypothetical protein